MGTRARLRRVAQPGAAGELGALDEVEVEAGRAGRDGSFAAGLVRVGAALRSGAPPATAWWRGMGVRTQDGVPVLADLAERWPGEPAGARAASAAAQLTAQVGVAPATVLSRVAEGLARDAEAAGQRRAAIAGPRSTARVLALLPVLGVLLGLALGADPWEVLLDGGAGSGLLVAGGVLTWVGHRWTGRYLRAAAAAGEES